jgi:hypothetical protein
VLRDVSKIKQNVQRENIRCSALMMEVADPSDTPVNVYHTTWRYILKVCRTENLNIIIARGWIKIHDM